MRPGRDPAVFPETDLRPVQCQGTVVAAPDVVFPRPDHLERFGPTCGGPCLHHPCHVGQVFGGRGGAAPEPAAGEHGVNAHLPGLQFQDARDRRLVDGLELGAGPDVASLAVAGPGNLDDRVQRLHRCVGEERKPEVCRDRLLRPRHAGKITGASRDAVAVEQCRELRIERAAVGGAQPSGPSRHGRGVDRPPAGSGLDEHRACPRAQFPVLGEAVLDGVGYARHLDAESRILVGLARRREFRAYPVPVGIRFFGQDPGQAGMGALPDLQAVDRSVGHERRDHACERKPGDEGRGLPVAVRLAHAQAPTLEVRGRGCGPY